MLEAFLEEESFEGGQVQGQGQWQKELRSTGTALSHTRICRCNSSLRGLMPWFHRPVCGSRPQGPKEMGLALLPPSAHPYLSPSVGWEGEGHKPGTAMHSDPHQIRECELCSEPSSCFLPEGGQRLLLWGQGVPRGEASSSLLWPRDSTEYWRLCPRGPGLQPCPCPLSYTHCSPALSQAVSKADTALVHPQAVPSGD